MKTLLFLCFLLAGVFAQSPQWIIWDSSTVPLPGNDVLSILQHPVTGHYWIGTIDGLVEFDGHSWTTYDTANSGLPHNRVNAVAVDFLNDLWLGTDGGVVRVDGNTWTVFDTSNSGLPTNIVQAIAVEDTHTLWFGTYWAGLVRYDGQSWTVYDRNNSPMWVDEINLIRIDSVRAKWVGTDGGGLFRFDDTSWTAISCGPFLANSSGAVSGLAFDAAGRLWVSAAGFPDSSLAVFFPGGCQLFTTSQIGFQLAPSLGVAIDQQNNVWIGTAYGLVKYDGQQWKRWNGANSPLPIDRIGLLLIDSYDNKWMGLWESGHGRGLAIFNENGIGGGIVSVREDEQKGIIPGQIQLRAYPNPFNPSTQIEFTLPTAMEITLSVYNVLGQQLAVLQEGPLRAGTHRTSFQADDLPAGVYTVVLRTPQGLQARKVVLVR